MSDGDSNHEMTFWDHLDVLRNMLFRVAIVIAILMIIVFFSKDFVFGSVIFSPSDSDFCLYRWLCKLGESLNMPEFCPEPFKIEIININLSAQFFTHMSASFWLGLILAFPYFLYEIWRFVCPALYKKEKRYIRVAFGFGGILFFMGVLLGYFVIFPLTLKFLGTYQVTETVVNQISLSSYISTFTSLILIMGVIFEIPMVALVLSKLGVIRRPFLRKYRKHAIICSLILSAVITPSGDAFTLLMVALPLILLYEFSILIVKK
ncbi:MAG: twin-arginine translocase subunit TatC [Prevotellaceae bacterium]|jgi:sec-independent protein translocase protein TatC|nr:twin-arginine translocase subunit TatC [Prevotellaceae bacterium]